jgi:hypothetical protein
MRRYFPPAGIAAIFAFLGALIVFCIAFDVTHATPGRESAIAAIAAVAPFVSLFVPLFIVFSAPFFTRNTQKPNHPRINHLRIAGKYQEQGLIAERGLSPLRLR